MQTYPIGVYGFSCICCGKHLEPEDEIVSCDDCCAIFCKDCVEDGEFEEHICEPDEI